MTPGLSLVIPAYNESHRLAESLAEVARWAPSCPLQPLELILADDGSSDGTLAVIREFAATWGGGRVVVLPLPHRGKGATVRAGVLASQGERVLFSDADLSTPLTEVERLLAALDQGADVAIGSRELEGAQREEEPGYRHLMGRTFNAVVQALVLPGIRDSQCGFKLFRGPVARHVFARLEHHGPRSPVVVGPMVTAFDVEVLYVARRLGYRIAEVGVRWIHAEGSKVQPVRDSLRMLRDVLAVRAAAWRGAYG